MGNIKEINIKNQRYYFFDDMMNIEDFDSNLLKLEKNSHQSTDIIALDISQWKILVMQK